MAEIEINATGRKQLNNGGLFKPMSRHHLKKQLSPRFTWENPSHTGAQQKVAFTFRTG
jgi:hypothetical protein